MIKFSTGETVSTIGDVYVRDEFLSGFNRSVATITTEGIDYAEAASLFVDGAVWSIVDDQGTQYDEWNDYTKAGPITDNRDDTLTVKMGKANTTEQDAIAAKQEAEEKSGKVSASLVQLAGKYVETDSDVETLRKSFEAAADTLSDQNAGIAPSLFKAWSTNEGVRAGWRRYFAPDNAVYKALKDHATNLNIAPDVSTEYWEKL